MQTSFNHTIGNILCCMCATPIPPNPSNMCVNCIRGQVDITEGIPKQLLIHFCNHCGRYNQPPNAWLNCELESRELLTLCVKRVKGLNKAKLVDAGFVWTEPHSRRIKIKLTIQKEVFTSTILQQSFVVEFVVQNQQCPDCQASFTDHNWKAVVQVRQKIDHKRTFYFVEQLILKHNAHMQSIKIKDLPDGLDFYFSHKSHAAKFVDFLQAVVPVRYKTSEKLISHDTHSNTYNYHYTFSVEIAPVCREDLVLLPKRVSVYLGNVSQFVLCCKVSNVLHFIDPNTLQGGEITSPLYWQAPFESVAQTKQMIEFIVLDISPLGPTRSKYVLADVTVARVKDFGNNDRVYLARTHLGHVLRPGDYAVGYDVNTLTWDGDASGIQNSQLPDVVLVRKSYPETRKRNKPRGWRLKTIPKEESEGARNSDLAKADRDFEQFQRDLEEDPEYRHGLQMYKVPGAEHIIKNRKQEDVEGLPEPDLDDLIEDMADMSLHETMQED